MLTARDDLANLDRLPEAQPPNGQTDVTAGRQDGAEPNCPVQDGRADAARDASGEIGTPDPGTSARLEVGTDAADRSDGTSGAVAAEPGAPAPTPSKRRPN